MPPAAFLKGSTGRADLQAGDAFMGHKRLENTVRYSKLTPKQFEGLLP